MDYKAIIRRRHNWRNNHFRQELNEPQCIIAEMSAVIETLLAEREAVSWISVGDRLPEFYDWVLVAVESVAGPLWIATAYRTRLVSGDWYWWWFGYPSSIGDVTHWMPLPTPPDRQQTEKE